MFESSQDLNYFNGDLGLLGISIMSIERPSMIPEEHTNEMYSS